MTNSYLIEVIKALLPEEREEIRVLLSAPQLNRANNAKEMARLYQIVYEAAPDFSTRMLQKNVVYGQIFSDKTMVNGKLDKLMADLNKVIRNYAISKQYLADENEVQKQVDWAKWLRKRSLAERSRSVIAKLKTHIDEERPESLERYREAFLVSEEKYRWESLYNQLKGDLGITNLLYDLELYFQNYRTELYNLYLIQQKGPQLPELTWQNVKADFWEGESTLLHIQKGISSILGKGIPTVKEFQDLMQLLKSKEATLSFDTLAQFYAYLRNTCTLLINGGNLEFIPILHEIQKDNLERKYFMTNGEISPNVYLNVVQVATRAKEWEWAKQFTETYKDCLIGGDHDRLFYRFNMANCLFAARDFEGALQLLPEVSSSSHYHHIVRRLELKIYYETESDLLPYKIDAFRKHIERTGTKALSSNEKTLHVNFINILNQLYQSQPKDKNRAARLTERINSRPLVAERAWLLEKASALK